jgi:hypothetical protein
MPDDARVPAASLYRRNQGFCMSPLGPYGVHIDADGICIFFPLDYLRIGL